MRFAALMLSMLFVMAACGGGDEATGTTTVTLPDEAKQALDAAIQTTGNQPIYQFVSVVEAPNAQNLPGAANPDATEVWCVILAVGVPALVLRPIASGQPGESPINTVISTHFSVYRFGQGAWVVSAGAFSNWPEIGCEE